MANKIQEAAEATNAVAAVSYTHLDVYKRQLLYFLQKKYTLPNDEEMAECKDFVLKNIVKDILGRS